MPGSSRTEASLALDVVLRAARRLGQAGVDVVLVRTGADALTSRANGSRSRPLTASQVKRELERRNACVNRSGAKALVSVHFNSLADPSAAGTETVFNDNRPFASASRRLARAVHRAVVRELGTNDRGVVTDESRGGGALTARGAAYGQLLQLGPASGRWFRLPTRVPAAVVEPLFVTSPADLDRLRDARSRQRLAASIADATAAFLRS